MADQQLSQSDPSVTDSSPAESTPATETVRLTGPGGTDYRLDLPESAEEREIAAITATVSAHLSAESAAAPATPASEGTSGLWTKANRYSARNTRSRPRVSGQTGWQVAARCPR